MIFRQECNTSPWLVAEDPSDLDQASPGGGGRTEPAASGDLFPQVAGEDRSPELEGRPAPREFDLASELWNGPTRFSVVTDGTVLRASRFWRHDLFFGP